MKTICYIYGLLDPITREIRYVGKTVNLKRRIKEHLSPSETKSKSHKNEWIKSLARNGLKPAFRILQEVSIDDWQEAEKFHIKKAKSRGHRLTNTTEGGEGYDGSVEVSEKISNSLKGIVFSEERNRKISESLKGHPVSEETRRKIGEANKSHKGTLEGNKKISEKAKERGKFSEEHKAKMSAAMKGKHKGKIPWNKGLKMEFKPRGKRKAQIDYFG